MQSLGLALTKGAMALQAALPAAPSPAPTPEPTINFNGKVEPHVKTFVDNLISTGLYFAAAVFVGIGIVQGIKAVRGKNGHGGYAIGAIVLAVICLIPTDAMGWARDMVKNFQN